MEMKPTSAPMTPMLTQYLDIKKRYSDCILFYRMGDFYEMFFEDALTAAPLLEVQLTSRDRNAENPIPMCGIPYHALSSYLQKLVSQGYKVALCEQVEDPKAAKGIVKRDVVRVVTPALVGDPELVSEEKQNWLLALNETDLGIEVSVLDLLASQLKWGTTTDEKMIRELFFENTPQEILVPDNLKNREWFKALVGFFSSCLVTYRNDFFEKEEMGTVKALRKYLLETQKVETHPHFTETKNLFENSGLRIDSTTVSSLELVKNNSYAEGATLLSVLDRTSTAMGRRLLKNWILHPLASKDAIEARLEAVGVWVNNPALIDDLTKALSQMRDLERLATKTALTLSNPRDLVAIREVQKKIPEIKQTLFEAPSSLLKTIAEKLESLPDLTHLLEQAMEDEPPIVIKEGGMIRSDFHPEVGEYRKLTYDAKGAIASLENKEREKTGIGSLKIKYSKVFGYTIEITRSHLAKVPEHYIRKQTIANGERFLTEELKNLEEKMISGEFRLKSLEEQLFLDLRQKVAREAKALLQNSRLLAELDVLLSLAKAARTYGYTRPEFHSGWQLEIVEGRHPVVERLLPVGQFVSNSIQFEAEECRTWLLTGPNMGGKSTIMRQVALISLMAQMGGFVPAANAKLPVVDAIFTRIGSSDDLVRGRSTFMVEMSEVARILDHATSNSLILIDEIGRGTSTYDGLSLAWSLLEYLHNDTQAKTLFATHFHELTQLEKSLPGLRNGNVLVDRSTDQLVFLYRLAPGVCSQSYGIEVAKLAGIPGKVLSRAKDLLALLESQSQKGSRARNKALEIHINQLGLFDESKSPEMPVRIEN